MAEEIVKRQPWDQRHDEPNLWYDRFRDYRDHPVGERSFRKAWLNTLDMEERKEAERLNRSVPGSFADMYRQYEWKDRADAHDRYDWGEQDKAEKALRMNMRRRRRSHTDTMLKALEERAKHIGKPPKYETYLDKYDKPQILKGSEWYPGLNVTDKEFVELSIKLQAENRAEMHDAGGDAAKVTVQAPPAFKGDADLDKMTPDERREKMRELTAQMEQQA